MAIPRKKRGTGGFLNNVTAVIQSYDFEQKTGEITKGDRKGQNYKKFSAKLTILPDGAQQPVTQFLDGGFLDGDLEISEDGKSIEGDDTYYIDDSTEWGKFAISIVEGEGQKLAEDDMGDWRSYPMLDGARATLKRVRDAEATERRGKRKDKKTGKEYDRDQLLIGDFLAKGGVTAKAKGGKTTAKAKPAAVTVMVEDETADAALKAILSGVDNGTIARSALSGAVLRYAMAQKLSTEDREALRKVLVAEDYQSNAADRGVIVIDGEGKNASLVLAA